MSSLLRVSHAILQPHHASEAEYLAFAERFYSTPRSVVYYQGIRRQFVEAYPDLRAWFAAPLVERVGRLRGAPRADLVNRVCYRARPYLYFLALRGYATFDWAWLIAVPSLHVGEIMAGTPLRAGVEQLVQEAVNLGYNRLSSLQALEWVVIRFFLHTGLLNVDHISEQFCNELAAAVRQFEERPDVPQFFGSVEQYRCRARKDNLTAIHRLQTVLYHRGQIAQEPHKIMPLYAERPQLPPQLQEVVNRYLAVRELNSRPSTVKRLEVALRHFTSWLVQQRPEIISFAAVTRDLLLAYATALETMTNKDTGKPLSPLTKIRQLSAVSTFFREMAEWNWDNVPGRPLLGSSDLPKLPERIPRYIPEPDLQRLMQAIRALPCPYQRAALLIARWSGARREEIRRLAVDCLDQYPDGTPRLRIPAGKTKRERVIPLHEEAAEAIRTIQALRHQEERGFRDPLTGEETRYLFLHKGKPYSLFYLFERSLQLVCEAAGLVDGQGKHAISAHRFRHTVGTQLAERGAKLQTIMAVLGHTSASMSMVYASISDQTVLKEYQAVLGPGATIAGPFADILRAGKLSAEAVDWLKTNFFKTELELGRCLRLPQEGPCECDLYLSCAKFVTTPEYAPRLRHRRQIERQLIKDAEARGWSREVERHQCTLQRLEHLLAELGEPLEGPSASE